MIESGWYPPGAEFDPNAPYNQIEVPQKDFEVTCSQSLSRTAIVTTNNYTPGASGVDYEPDDEGDIMQVVGMTPMILLIPIGLKSIMIMTITPLFS